MPWYIKLAILSPGIVMVYLSVTILIDLYRDERTRRTWR